MRIMRQRQEWRKVIRIERATVYAYEDRNISHKEAHLKDCSPKISSVWYSYKFISSICL